MATKARPNEESSSSKTPLTSDKDIKMCLVLLAETKQAEVTQSTLSAYSVFFRDFELEDITVGIKNLMIIPRREGETAFPEVGTVLQYVRNAKAERLARSRRRFFCGDCQGDNGMLYFDARGERLRGVDIVAAADRTAKRCPCGGVEHDWAAMHRDRERNPEAYMNYGEWSDAFTARHREARGLQR